MYTKAAIGHKRQLWQAMGCASFL